MPGKPPAGPLSPREELATFRVPAGFRVELVASEPEVVDPVAMAFDEDGRLYVAEMRGYPNGGVGTGAITSGQIRRLEDRNGDGVFEHSTVFATGLRFPTGVMPYKKGLLVANPPDLIYLEDTDADGKADRTRILYAGFGLANIQQLLNSLQWGLDNWVYGLAGSNGGTITCPENPSVPAVELRGRGIRFHPDIPGSLEPISGGGQYGLAADAWGRWFTATNSQHLRHMVLPDHYLRRNPLLAVSAVTLDIPDHGAACKVHRLSPFEAWRVERTQRRKDGPDATRFSATELVPGGFITSGCSPVVYSADQFPESHRGNTFVCDPANNLIHRDILEPSGATFVAKRGDADCEFLASTDNWFRPVWLSLGPDGGLYVLDFYREAIETPLSLPDDIKARLNLESRGRGRIWRVTATGQERKKGRAGLRDATTDRLVSLLADPNSWWRLNAQRLLVERRDKSAIDALRRLAQDARQPLGQVHALWTLEGLNALDEKLLANVLTTAKEPGLVENALRLADSRLGRSARLLEIVTPMTSNPSPRVRFQLAFTLGQADHFEAAAALARLARNPASDSWTQTAILSSAASFAPELLAALVPDKDNQATAPLSTLSRLGALAGMKGRNDDWLMRTLELLEFKGPRPAAWQAAVFQGLAEGLERGPQPLSRLGEKSAANEQRAVALVAPYFRQAAQAAQDDKQALAERTAAVRLLGHAPSQASGPALKALLTPQTPAELQLAAVRALGQQANPGVAAALLAPWNTFSPSIRREVLEALFARKERLTALLDAVADKQITINQLEPARVEQLRKHPDASIRDRAVKLLAGQGTPDRLKVVQEYAAALELSADVGRGKAVFKRVCATCHRLDEVGVEVGPNLLAALRNKTRAGLVTDLLDPSKEVDARYVLYLVTTTAGRQFSGMIAADTASSLTLRRAEKAEDTILRTDIDDIQATAKSLMPENLETQLNKQDLADVIAYLMAAAVGK